MKILPASPPLPRGVRSSLKNRNRDIEIQVCLDSSRTVNLTSDDGAEEASIDDDDDFLEQIRAKSLQNSSYGDGDYGSVLSGNRGISSSHLFKGSADWKDGDEGDADDDEDDGDDDIDDDDDDDGMQWANSRRPLETAPQSFGYGRDHKGFNYAGKMASGKENKVRISRKLAFQLQQHAGPIKPNSGPFSGPLKAAAKPNMAPSIIPVNLKCKKVLGFDICDPMSPEVTCLGRIKIKEAHNKPAHGTTASETAAVAAMPKVEKGKCFDTKNQLCGKRPKGRKKKKAEKSKCLARRKRIAPKEAIDRSQSFPSSEHGETRREKAASLARSLTDLLEDVRRHKKERMDYVPSVPPPNSLLLMRGCRRRDESYSPSRLDMVDTATSDVEGYNSHGEVVEALDEGGFGDDHMKNLRKNAGVHFSLLDLIDMEDEDFSTSEIEDTITTRRRRSHMKAQASQTLKANIEEGDTRKESGMEGSSGDLKKKETVSEGRSSRMRSPPVAALWQRRSFTELAPITIEHMKQKTDHRINR